MDAVIGAIVSGLGACYTGIDFCILYTFVCMGITFYKAWNDILLMIKLRCSKSTFDKTDQ